MEASLDPYPFEMLAYSDLSFLPEIEGPRTLDIFTPYFETLTGDQEIAAGLHLFETPGHMSLTQMPTCPIALIDKIPPIVMLARYGLVSPHRCHPIARHHHACSNNSRTSVSDLIGRGLEASNGS